MGKRFLLLWADPRDALVSLVYVLMLVGGENIFSASFVASQDMFGNEYHYLIRYWAFGLPGLVLMHAIGRKGDYHKLFPYVQRICVFLIGLLLFVDGYGKTLKGAQRWLILGPISFQPSELVKLAVILLGANYLGRLMEEGKQPHLLRKDTCLAFLEAAFMSFLVLIQPDMGTAAIILALMIVLYVVAGLPYREIFVLLASGAALATAAVIQAPYRLNRVLVWLDPWSDPQGNGYQAVQSFVAIGSGGISGMGHGMGSSKFFFLPEAHTDFAFAVFCQEWGFLGALLMLLVFIIMGLALYRIGKETQDRRGFLLVTGVNFLVVGQAIANMAMVCGILPVIGVPLPFISYGGTSLVITQAAIGLVLSVCRLEKAGRERTEAPQGTLRFQAERKGAGRWRP
ncbi:putative peptidoglycan glycosyltransferase FtsW [uncultured Acidaminococcus sp.]|uniref:FtsW/RodA/SpoVE family cell cycle protein n=1 Tax=uncultured Acidaminococcus sp. TaxID=352152 RepID=UPI002631A940|nr:putative peptidoglycan glycosyltransferase FtsW [uncultured Acidaminococcus sp.]